MTELETITFFYQHKIVCIFAVKIRISTKKCT